MKLTIGWFTLIGIPLRLHHYLQFPILFVELARKVIILNLFMNAALAEDSLEL
jgi:hypothetical protein